jgi:hypothetical protein
MDKVIQAIEKQLEAELKGVLADRTPKQRQAKKEWRKAHPPSQRFACYPVTDLLNAPPEALAPGEWECKHAIRALAKVLFAVGGRKEMEAVCDRLVERDPDHEAARASIIDHGFDGIGGWVC